MNQANQLMNIGPFEFWTMWIGPYEMDQSYETRVILGVKLIFRARILRYKNLTVYKNLINASLLLNFWFIIIWIEKTIYSQPSAN